MSLKGLTGFDHHYEKVYGHRWVSLRAALTGPVRQVARANEFASPSESGATERFAGRTARTLNPGERIEPKPSANGLFDFYVMDPASIFAAVALDPQPGEEILDLCAAPGGKSLVLAERLSQRGSLVSNEMSDRRRARLRAVFDDYLPAELLNSGRVRVTGHDGAKWCLHQTDAFDRILVDAPCSGERHMLATPEEMKLWSPARSKNLAVRQYSLLASAHRVVRPGGRIVYSTCSISPLENDAVIARLLKKRPGEARVVKPECSIGESTEHGWMLLPDLTGYGPIYFAVLERT